MRTDTAPLTAAAYAVVALVVLTGAAFPVAAEALRPGPLVASWQTVVRSAGWAAGPAAVLLLVARWARGHPLAAWAAVVGTLLTLALGLALYAAALRPDARVFAPAVALTFVPLRQLVAAVVVGWGVWLARRTR